MIKKIIFILFAVFIIIPTLLPLFNDGFFVVHDNTQVERVFQMTKSLSDGQFPVRWVEDLGYGYGYPIFNFYAPLPYYIGGFLNLGLSDSLIATKLMFGIGAAISFFTMYLFSLSLTKSRAGAVVAGVIYLYFPYHAANIYVRGAVGEFFAYAFLPLVFWGIYNIFESIQHNKNKKTVILNSFIASLPVALVIISHNLSAFMMGIFLAFYALFLLLKSKKKKDFLYSLIILFSTAFLLSAFYVIPAALESRYTDVSSQVGGGAHYADHFVCINQLWHSNWGFGGSIPGCIDGMSFSLGKFNITLILIAFAFFTYSSIKKKTISREFIIWVLFFFSIFLTLSYSKFVWDNLPFMEYLQYPWRFINFSGLFIALLIAYFVSDIKNKKILIAILLVVIPAQIYLNAKLFSPIELNNLSSKYYENIEHIRFDTSRISDEYMPPDFTIPQSISDLKENKIEIIAGEGSLVFTENKTSGQKININMQQEGVIRINTAYFPAWQIYINDRQAPYIIKDDGLYLPVSEGTYNIEIKFVETSIEKAANILSIVGIAVLIVGIIGKRYLYGKKNS